MQQYHCRKRESGKRSDSQHAWQSFSFLAQTLRQHWEAKKTSDIVEHDVLSLTGIDLLCSLQNLRQTNAGDIVSCQSLARLTWHATLDSCTDIHTKTSTQVYEHLSVKPQFFHINHTYLSQLSASVSSHLGHYNKTITQWLFDFNIRQVSKKVN